MYKLLRYWNQNRKKILITIGTIALIIIVIQFLNYIVREQSKRESENRVHNNVATEPKDITKPNYSIITNTEISSENVEENTDIIKSFVNYCNQQEYSKAYELLTDSCKESAFKTEQQFIDNYCKNIFGTEKSFSLELWINNKDAYTYKIIYTTGKMLEIGGNSSVSNREDYITVIKENGKTKLNINKFIKRQDIQKEVVKDNITIKVDYKYIYLNYEIYSFVIRNETNKEILIANGSNSKQISVVDNNNNEYISYINEIPIESLSLKPGYEKKINIKFNKIYDTYRTIEKVKFSNILLDIDNTTNSKDESIERIVTIEIDI